MDVVLLMMGSTSWTLHSPSGRPCIVSLVDGYPSISWTVLSSMSTDLSTPASTLGASFLNDLLFSY